MSKEWKFHSNQYPSKIASKT